MIRDIELAFIKLHILYHAGKEEIFGIGMIEELAEQFEEKEHALFGEGGFQTILGQVTDLEKELGIYELSQFTPSF